jgi:CRP/FNR family transcriptional regulator, cyclic AMP receptor protein
VSALLRAVHHLSATTPEIKRLSTLQRFASLFTQGQNADSLFIIDDGLIKLTRVNAVGDRIILAMCGPGDIAGEEALGGPASTYNADAEVLTATSGYQIPRETLNRLVHHDVELANMLIDFLLKRRQTLAEKVELLCLHDVEYRILHYLAELSSLVRPEADSGGYRVPITQAELANMIGATRETTSTTLNQLEKRGLLKLSRRLLTIPSPALLRSAVSNQETNTVATAVAAKAV